MDRVIVFDVNETLLDVGALDPFFQDRFGDVAVRREWFGQMLQSAFVTTITGQYRDFGTLAMDALSMVAMRHGVDLGDQDRAELGAGMRTLPPHPEVRAAMERLHQAGYRLATLTNSRWP
jgi:2-haloacid dehalogenase